MQQQAVASAGFVSVDRGYDACSPGDVAEWLGRGLQSLVQRFESARRLRGLEPSRLRGSERILFAGLLHLSKGGRSHDPVLAAQRLLAVMTMKRPMTHSLTIQELAFIQSLTFGRSVLPFWPRSTTSSDGTARRSSVNSTNGSPQRTRVGNGRCRRWAVRDSIGSMPEHARYSGRRAMAGGCHAPVRVPRSSQGIVSFGLKAAVSWSRMWSVRSMATGWRPPGPEW